MQFYALLIHLDVGVAFVAYTIHVRQVLGEEGLKKKLDFSQ